MADRNCVVCGTSFEARADAVYCSAACRQAALRARQASDAQARVGGIVVPVTELNVELGSFGQVGTASLTVPAHALEGVTFTRSPIGTLPIEVRFGEEVLFAGDVLRRTRDVEAGLVQIQAQDYMGRLSDQRWSSETWWHLTLAQFLEGAARRADLLWTMPPEALEARPLGSLSDADGCASGGSRSALELLLWLARESGADLRVAEGELIFAPPVSSEPRSLTGRAVKIISNRAADVSVIVRSHLPLLVGGGIQDKILRTQSLMDIPAGRPVYLVVVHRHREADVDLLHERYLRELAAGLLAVEFECDDTTLIPGASVRIETATDLPLRVIRTKHNFSTDTGLVMRLEAMHLPAPPAIPSALPRALPPRVVAPAGLAA